MNFSFWDFKNDVILPSDDMVEFIPNKNSLSSYEAVFFDSLFTAEERDIPKLSTQLEILFDTFAISLYSLNFESILKRFIGEMPAVESAYKYDVENGKFFLMFLSFDLAEIAGYV